MTGPETTEQKLERIDGELAAFRSLLGGIDSIKDLTEVDIYPFEGGLIPERKTDGAIGFDAYARAIVDPASAATEASPLRRSMADFQKSPEGDWREAIDPQLRHWAFDDPDDESKYVIDVPRRERVMVGLGFATRMRFPMFYWVAPRSGYASRGITVANSPGTVDPDYRGEAGALVENNSTSAFRLSHNMRIVQVIFSPALIPHLREVSAHDELGGTGRGAGGFGSTGTH